MKQEVSSCEEKKPGMSTGELRNQGFYLAWNGEKIALKLRRFRVLVRCLAPGQRLVGGEALMLFPERTFSSRTSRNSRGFGIRSGLSAWERYEGSDKDYEHPIPMDWTWPG